MIFVRRGLGVLIAIAVGDNALFQDTNVMHPNGLYLETV